VNVALIGAGRVCTGVALLLKRSGHRIVAVAPEDRGSTRRAEALFGARASSAIDAARAADLVLVGAPDEALPEVAGAIAPALRGGFVVCHFAGAFGTEVLAPVAAHGALRAAIHPLQSCPDPETAARRLPGSAWGVTCDEAASPRVVKLIEDDLSGRVVWVDEEARPVWHAASAIAANGFAALLILGEELLRAAGIKDPVPALGPLAAGVVANALEGGGGAQTLTGPVARGDVATLRRHVEALERSAPESLVGYRRAAAVIITAAQHAGRIDDVTAARIRDQMEGR
jgi:predicted short-subunit dehydrogenase-like oxidoreductase (DUF2520 family)